MRRALRLAGRGYTSPNPMVGAVLVKNLRIIGEGYHHRAGMPHAEVEALRDAGEVASGADLYVNLEPCCHFGRTPPCTDAIISAGVRRVFAAMLDPNPKVSGRGVDALRNAGVETRIGLLEDEARRLNEAYIKFVTTGLPFVTLKMAMTLDGKIATRTGDSKWVSSEAARKHVHRMRARNDAVLVGLGTVLADDPELSVRGVGCPRQPLRVVADGLAETPPKARILSSGESQVVIVVTADAPADRVRALQSVGARVITLGAGTLVDLKSLINVLGAEDVTSILIEGGGELAASALESKIVDKVVVFIAAKIVGGRDAKSPVEGVGLASMADALRLENVTVKRIGTDILVEAYPKY